MKSPPLSRRQFIGAVSTAATAAGLPHVLAAATPTSLPMTDIPIIDTHIHLFDPTRPEGVPWPPKENATLYKPALPERYRQLAVSLGVKGAIEVECSTWLEDNQWVLDVCDRDPIMVGAIGNLVPGQPEFRRQLERFARNPLFRGIRYGNLWDRDLGTNLAKPGFVSDLKALADAGLVLDTANPDAALIEAVVRTTDQVPSLRVVLDHLPKLTPPPAGAARDAYQANLRELGRRPQVYVKVSAILREENGRISQGLDFYRPRLDEIWDIFGEDRLLYGSDWPHSDQWGDYGQVLAIARAYFATKSRAAAEKYFWKNSVAAYRWIKRDGSQPS